MYYVSTCWGLILKVIYSDMLHNIIYISKHVAIPWNMNPSWHIRHSIWHIPKNPPSVYSIKLNKIMTMLLIHLCVSFDAIYTTYSWHMCMSFPTEWLILFYDSIITKTLETTIKDNNHHTSLTIWLRIHSIFCLLLEC